MRLTSENISSIKNKYKKSGVDIEKFMDYTGMDMIDKFIEKSYGTIDPENEEVVDRLNEIYGEIKDIL